MIQNREPGSPSLSAGTCTRAEVEQFIGATAQRHGIAVPRVVCWTKLGVVVLCALLLAVAVDAAAGRLRLFDTGMLAGILAWVGFVVLLRHFGQLAMPDEYAADAWAGDQGQPLTYPIAAHLAAREDHNLGRVGRWLRPVAPSHPTWPDRLAAHRHERNR